MRKHCFITFLLNNKYVSVNELRRALGNQHTVPACIGVAALDARLLSAHEVFTLKSLQAQTGRPFGELAVLHGFLSKDQIPELLCRQTKAHILFQNNLIDMHILTLTELEHALENFERAGNAPGCGPEYCRDSDVRACVDLFLPAQGTPDIPLQSYTFTALIEQLTELAHGGLRFAPGRSVRTYAFEWLVCQEIKGEICMLTGLSGCTESMAGLAALFAREESTDMDALARDAVGEFINYYNAHLLAKISDDGLDLELDPPSVIHRGMIASAENIYKIPFSLPCGSYEFLLAGTYTVQSGL